MTYKPNASTRILMVQMALVRLICKLGHDARAKAGIKLRQPLNKAVAYIDWDEVEKKYGDYLSGKTDDLPE